MPRTEGVGDGNPSGVITAQRACAEYEGGGPLASTDGISGRVRFRRP